MIKSINFCVNLFLRILAKSILIYFCVPYFWKFSFKCWKLICAIFNVPSILTLLSCCFCHNFVCSKSYPGYASDEYTSPSPADQPIVTTLSLGKMVGNILWDMSVCMSVCLSVCLSVFLSVCMSVCLWWTFCPKPSWLTYCHNTITR